MYLYIIYVYVRAGGSSLELVRPNLTLSTIQLNVRAVDKFNTADTFFYQFSMML